MTRAALREWDGARGDLAVIRAMVKEWGPRKVIQAIADGVAASASDDALRLADDLRQVASQIRGVDMRDEWRGPHLEDWKNRRFA